MKKSSQSSRRVAATTRPKADDATRTAAAAVAPKNASVVAPASGMAKEDPARIAASPASRGRIDAIVGHRLHGWVVTPGGAEDEPRQYLLFIDNQPYARFSARTYRPDLEGVACDDGLCGFRIPLQAPFDDGKEHEFSLRVGSEPETELHRRTLRTPRSISGSSLPRQDVQGYVDKQEGLFLLGWAHDPEPGAAPVVVELLAAGETCGYAVADRYRQDIADSGVGNGQHGFALRIPNHLLEGPPVELTVRECTTGTLLLGSGITVGRVSDVPHGGILEVHGAYLNGWIHEPRGFGAPVDLHLWVDGERVGIGRADSPRSQGDGLEFWLRIPDRYLDNRPHELSISSVEHADAIYAQDMRILPATATPLDALQRYAGNSYLRGYLSPLGPQRYESLRRGLANLAQSCEDKSSEFWSVAMLQLEHMVRGQTALMRGHDVNPSECPSFAFQEQESPRVSIVIPAHNQYTVTYTCLASIAAAVNRAAYEVIVVDDGSSDETAAIGQHIGGLRVLRNPAALGFVMACNAGAELARGEFIVMLNNDTEVMSGWLDELLEPFSRFEGVGMTGAKLIYPDGRLQEAGGIVWGNGQPWNVGRNGNASDPRYNYVRQVDYLSGACIMLPTAIWRKLGGFDRHFAPAYYEDTDLAFGVRALGYKTVYTPFCEVVHYEGVSNGTDTAGSGLKRYQDINQPKFRAKWCNAYRGNGILGQDLPELMQDRNVSGRALVIDAQTLTPDQDAGSYSAMQEIRILQSLGFKVTFLPSNLAYMGGYTETLQRMGVEVIFAPFATSMAEVIEKRAQEFDVFYIARYGVAMQIVDTIRAVRPDARIVLNIHDLHFLRELREALASRDREHLERAVTTREEELRVMRSVDVVVTYSEVEQAIILSHNLDSTRTAACPWVVDVVETCPAFDVRRDIAFLGGFGHRPNLDAVQWFVREVMPLLRKRLEGVRFLIYGSKAPASLKALECDDVVLKGYVRNTGEVYDSARVFLAPLLTGAGLKGKVIGAFARGIPTVMTPTASESTGARNGVEAFIVTRPEEWVEAIAKIYQDEKAWNRMSEACRQLARDEYSFAKGQEKIQAALQLGGVYANRENQTIWSKFPVS